MKARSTRPLEAVFIRYVVMNCFRRDADRRIPCRSRQLHKARAVSSSGQEVRRRDSRRRCAQFPSASIDLLRNQQSSARVEGVSDFQIVEEAPNRKVTLIGPDAIGSPMGSGRGFDGVKAWDKSFIGTGLRTLEGRELADAARDADVQRLLHLLDDCPGPKIATRPGGHTVTCDIKSGGTGSSPLHQGHRRRRGH